MNETKPAAFAFEKYKINSFSFNEPDTDQPAISVNFIPSGTYFQSSGIFVMHLEFIATYKEGQEKEYLRTFMQADFKFREAVPFEELPGYFYRNSIAIVYPYLRAFVSTLTLIANIKPLMLPILNLSSLEEYYKEHTNSV